MITSSRGVSSVGVSLPLPLKRGSERIRGALPADRSMTLDEHRCIGIGRHGDVATPGPLRVLVSSHASIREGECGRVIDILRVESERILERSDSVLPPAEAAIAGAHRCIEHGALS